MLRLVYSSFRILPADRIFVPATLHRRYSFRACLSARLPEVGGVFIQGESEVASANMAYGAAAAGVRSMTSSSSCGISLKSEAISWMAGARLPVVIANFQRGGPGIGTIQPAQQDYTQATKASGNGGFKMLVLSPSTLQEAVDMTWEAFDLADKYSNPVLLLCSPQED